MSDMEGLSMLEKEDTSIDVRGCKLDLIAYLKHDRAKQDI